jgi:hypothetical protein
MNNHYKNLFEKFDEEFGTEKLSATGEAIKQFISENFLSKEAVREALNERKNSTQAKDLMELEGTKITNETIKKIASISADVRQNVMVDYLLTTLLGDEIK